MAAVSLYPDTATTMSRIYAAVPETRRFDSLAVTVTHRDDPFHRQAVIGRLRFRYRSLRRRGMTAGDARMAIFDILFATALAEGTAAY